MRRLALWLTVGFVFSVPWEAAIHIGTFGRLSKATGAAAAATWLLSVLARGTTRPLSRFHKAYFLFLIWNGLTFFWSHDPQATLKGFTTYVQIFGMLLVLWDLIEDEREVGLALQAFVLGAYVSSLSVMVNWFTAAPTDFPEYQRIKALGFEVDGVALIIALAVPAAWVLATGGNQFQRGGVLTAVNFAYVPTALFAVILTGTRGAALGTVPSLLFILWTLREVGPKRRVVAWSAIAAGALAVALYAPREPLARITGSVTDVTSGDSLSGRRDIWSNGLDLLLDHPLTGVGLDSFRAASPFGKEAHNMFLSVLAETGLPGFLLFASALISVALMVVARRDPVGWYLLAQLSVILLGSMSLSLEDSKSVWILVSLAAIAADSSRREQQEHWEHEPSEAGGRVAGTSRRPASTGASR